MYYIDTHAHLDGREYLDDIDAVIKRASEAEVKKIINVACSGDTIMSTLELIEKFKNIYGALGIHPHHADEYNENVENNLIKKLAMNKIVALGEIGLDFFKEYSPRSKQIMAFKRQLKIAERFQYPVIIHCRDAYDLTYDILTEFNIKNGVMHCFSGDRKQVEKFLGLGLYISFTGTVTFRKSDLKALKVVPDNKLLLETDCPYMTPHPHRGKRNEPSYIPVIADKISRTRNQDLNKIKEMTYKNSLNLFKGI
ncbi:MAG: TatD family hydrolase [Candidatus Muiribacteriota bacterium]